uniref:outer membrane protein assembly factor BamB family protein n=1 Tax=Natrinema ejinorense TaxID=373386 RepID=UPI0024820A88|nr:PQQ-binding-like beta-propeller repeat protein [Natrinema ejinorense]
MKWTASLPSGPWTSPVIADGTVYIGADNQLLAYSIEDGDPIAFQFDELGTLTATPSIVDGKLLIPVFNEENEESALTKLNDDGEVIWKRNLSGGYPFSMDVHENTISIRTESMVFLLREDGTIKWEVETPTVNHDYLMRLADLSPILHNESVFIPSPNGLNKRDRETGVREWTSLQRQVAATPTVSGETIYCTSNEGLVTSIDKNTGKQNWRRSISGSWTAPEVDDETVYVTSGTDVLALDRTNGKTRWRLGDYGLHGDSYTDPVIVENTVITGSIGRTMTLVSANDGQRLDHYEGNGTRTAIAVDGDIAVAVDGDQLAALNLP